MKKWNMIIDVAECTNCNLCTLAAMDEYAGNEAWLFGTDAEARSQVDQYPAKGTRADADDRCRLRSDHVQSLRRPTMHEGGAEGGRDQAPRRHRDHRSGKGKRAAPAPRRLPVWSHLVERGVAAAASLAVRRAPARPRLETDARTAVLPDGR